MKCTVLVDNQNDRTRVGLRGEHGLSLLVETRTNTILFDSGASDLFLRNAKVLGIDLRKVDTFVLSHGHYDHGGGLAAFLRMNDKAMVYCGPGAMEPHAVKLFGFLSREIGLDRKALVPFSERIVTVDGMKEIAPDVHALSEIFIAHEVPKDMGTFYSKANGQLIKDGFPHETLLIVKEEDSIRVLTGCAHKGVHNILSASEKHFEGFSINALIGGLHMTNPLTKRLTEREEDIVRTGGELRNMVKLKKLYTGHCTGPRAYSLLRQEMGDKVSPLMVGRQFLI